MTPVPDPERDNWGDIGWGYFQALHEKFRVRVFANGMFHQAHIALGSRWASVPEVFGTPIEHPYINVVCGSYSDLTRYWTAGVKNVAITASINDDLTDFARRHWEEDGNKSIHMSRMLRLEQYDLVGCLTEDDAVELRAHGVLAKHLQPDEFVDYLKRTNT